MVYPSINGVHIGDPAIAVDIDMSVCSVEDRNGWIGALLSGVRLIPMSLEKITMR